MTEPPGGEALYQQRKRLAFGALRVGDVVTCQIGGRQQRAVVVEAFQPGVTVETEDGERHLMNVYSFGARIGWRE